MTLRLVPALDTDSLPPLRPGDLNRLRLVGAELGRALDAGNLPVTAAPAPAGLRLIDLVQEPRPLVTWHPSRWQLFCRKVRRFVRRGF